MSTAWSGISLTQVAATGNLTQLYPTFMSAGVAHTPSSPASPGSLVRQPRQGTLHSIQVRTDGADGGYIEIWDCSGEDSGLDMSSGTTITNAQLVALQTRGLARLLYRQDFTAGAGAATPSAPFRPFMRGLVGRFCTPSGTPAGTCELNLVVEGGAWYRQ